MKSAIWKYELETTDVQVIEIPQGAIFLTVQVQRGVPCLWAQVNPAARKTKRSIRIVGTGHEHTGCACYVGTYQLEGGALVFHVFDLGETL